MSGDEVETIGRLFAAVIVLISTSCGQTKVTSGAERAALAPCGRFQIVSGAASDFKTGRSVPTILRIDTETGRTWYWNPPGEMGRGGR